MLCLPSIDLHVIRSGRMYDGPLKYWFAHICFVRTHLYVLEEGMMQLMTETLQYISSYLPTYHVLTCSIRDSETSIDFVQGPPGSRSEWVDYNA